MDQKWYRAFVSDKKLGDTGTMCDGLFGVLTAANFMGIKQLIDLCLLRFTFRICGKSVDEIRTILRLPELTPEELAKARDVHPWMFENDGD